MTLFVQSCSGLIEPAPVTEIACSGLGRIEFIGGGLGGFVLYRNAITPEGAAERLICGRVFAPLEAMTEAMQLMMTGMVEARLVQEILLGRRRLMM
jgi:hypothetical protein